MQYLERTLQVKAALLEQPDLLEEQRATFSAHLGLGGERETIGRGNTRWVYNVGVCEIAPGVKVQLVLKLMKDPTRMSFSSAAKRWNHNEWSEFGAFETYYDFIAGHIDTLSFKSRTGYEKYITDSVLGKGLKPTFMLSESWGGTRVKPGDIGAIPYFQMAVRYGEWFGVLTEGEPPLVEPMGTAQDHGTLDDYTVERGRIIDLGPAQTLLIDIDRGGSVFSRRGRYPGNLGIRARGAKYFAKAHRLDIG